MNAPVLNWSALEQKARDVFGIASFRPDQRELIEAVLGGRDALLRQNRGDLLKRHKAGPVQVVANGDLGEGSDH